MDLDGDVRHRTISFSLAFCTDSNQEHSNLLSTPTITPPFRIMSRSNMWQPNAVPERRIFAQLHQTRRHHVAHRAVKTTAIWCLNNGIFWILLVSNKFFIPLAPAPPFPNLCLTLLAYTKVLDPSLFYLHMLCRKYCIPHVPLDLPNNAKICQSTIISDFNPAISSLGPMVLRR